jgi:hypothetical protein
MIMAAPENTKVEDRRETLRLRDLEGTTVLVEGKAAKLVDVAEGGLRVREGGAIYKGECVRVDAPWSEEPMFGYVLEVLPPGLRSESPETRIRVSGPLDLDRIRSFAASLQ